MSSSSPGATPTSSPPTVGRSPRRPTRSSWSHCCNACPPARCNHRSHSGATTKCPRRPTSLHHRGSRHDGRGALMQPVVQLFTGQRGLPLEILAGFGRHPSRPPSEFYAVWSSRKAVTSDSRNLRCPPGVRIDPDEPGGGPSGHGLGVNTEDVGDLCRGEQPSVRSMMMCILSQGTGSCRCPSGDGLRERQHARGDNNR